MAVKQLYPNQRPTLNLNFARSKALDPRITLTRSSTATYVGSDGLIKTAAAGEARFDYDPVTGECLGLLIEEGRTNLATNSTMESSDWQDFQSYQSDATIISSNNAAPDGTNTAVLMGEERTGNWNKSCYLRQNLTVSTAGDYVVSVFAKRSATSASDTVWIGLSAFTDSTPATPVRFRMDTLEWSAADTTASYADHLLPVEDYGNGWYRISVRYNLASTGLTGSIRIGIAKSSISGGAGFQINRNDNNWSYLWGAQVEEGSCLTSYIPSAVGSTGNRVADEASMTGTNFSDWFNEQEGTILVEGDIANPDRTNSNTQQIINIQGSGGSNRFAAYFDNNNVLSLDTKSSGTVQLLYTFSLPRLKIGLTYDATGGNAAADGDVGTANTNATLPILTNPGLHIGKNHSSNPITHLAHGFFTRIAYYPYRLTDLQLQESTR